MKRSFWDTAELYLSKELMKEGSTQAPESDINIHRSVVVACLVKPADLKAAAAAHATPLRRRGIQTLTLLLDLILDTRLSMKWCRFGKTIQEMLQIRLMRE